MRTIEQQVKWEFGCRVCINCNNICKGKLKVAIMYATRQHEYDMEQLKSILNALMIDTRDKAEILKAMEQL